MDSPVRQYRQRDWVVVTEADPETKNLLLSPRQIGSQDLSGIVCDLWQWSLEPEGEILWRICVRAM
jgi:hypothetical protein